ncbi:MAG: flagellar basal body protein FliL [Rhodobiaceae bacterium]|nr:MAG: flagellar basal body protein FliL [Rhodobiaceae bacterium]
MSDTDIDFDDSTGDGEEAPTKKLSGKVMVLFIALPAIVVIGGIVGALFAFDVFGGGEGDMEMVEVVEEERVPPVFFDMPEILVNMSTNGGPSRYLKMRVALEVPDEDVIAEIELVMPRVVDSFQVYLRELRPEDMEGSASIVRMKEELLRRVNLAVEPIHINDVLFKEVVVQ